ncbi:transposase [Shimazuella kribbensis]
MRWGKNEQPKCPNCGKTDKVVKTEDGNYGCQDCGDFFDSRGNKLKR